MFLHSNITLSYLVVVSPLLAQLNCGTNIKDSMNKPTSWQVCKQVNINWASDISLSMCAYLLACSSRPHSRLLVSIWPSNKVYHSHWLWASQQATRNDTWVTAYICIILHTQKLLLSYLGSQQWRNERGWIVQAITDDSLLSGRLLRFAVYGKWQNSHVIFKTTTKKISSSCLILGSGGSSDSDWVQRPLIFRLEDFRFDACSRNNRGWRSPFSSAPGGVYGVCSSSCTTHGNIKLRPTRAW